MLIKHIRRCCCRRCVHGLQGAGLKVLADIVINHRCAAAQDEEGVWNVFGGKLAWNADAVCHFAAP